VLAVSGLTRELDLLQHAEALTPALRHRHAEQAALVTAVDCAATAALAIATTPRRAADVSDAATPTRLGAIADECERLAAAAETRAAPLAGATRRAAVADVPVSRAHLAAVVELERSLTAARATLESLHAERDAAASPLDVRHPGWLTPAFSLANVEALRFAVKGGLAAMIAWVLYQGMGWPGISTCVVTTLLVAQSSVGAGQHKALLRVCGAVLGGVLAWALMIGVMPSLRGPVGWLAALAVPYAIAAWIAVGSSRIAYVGIQIALATALVLLDGFGPTTDLVAGRDRVLGIVLGIAVMTVIDRTLWPVWSGRETARHLAAALRTMARLALAGLHGGDGALLIAPAQGFRQTIYRELTSALQHRDEAHLEPGAPATAVERAHVGRLLGEAQTVFLDLLALARHRIDVVLDAVTEPVRAPLRELGEAVAQTLGAVADALETGAVAPVPDLDAVLARARTGVEAAGAPLGPMMRAHLEARLALYERVAASVGRLAADAGTGSAALALAPRPILSLSPA
jgi:multidrug resistance protein MdtO